MRWGSCPGNLSTRKPKPPPTPPTVSQQTPSLYLAVHEAISAFIEANPAEAEELTTADIAVELMAIATDYLTDDDEEGDDDGEPEAA